jgi:hypothetical protein
MDIFKLQKLVPHSYTGNLIQEYSQCTWYELSTTNVPNIVISEWIFKWIYISLSLPLSWQLIWFKGRRSLLHDHVSICVVFLEACFMFSKTQIHFTYGLYWTRVNLVTFHGAFRVPSHAEHSGWCSELLTTHIYTQMATCSLYVLVSLMTFLHLIPAFLLTQELKFLRYPYGNPEQGLPTVTADNECADNTVINKWKFKFLLYVCRLFPSFDGSLLHINLFPKQFISLPLLFWKNKSRLMRSPCCLCIPLIAARQRLSCCEMTSCNPLQDYQKSWGKVW